MNIKQFSFCLISIMLLLCYVANTASSANALKLTIPQDPCSDLWNKLNPKYQGIIIGDIQLDLEVLFKYRCNQYKADIEADIQAKIAAAKAAVQQQTQGRITKAQEELQKGFYAWVASDIILPRLPAEQRQKYQPNSPYVIEKAHAWLADPTLEIHELARAYLASQAPLIDRLFQQYLDLVQGESKKILTELDKVIKKARERLAAVTELNQTADAHPETPWSDLLEQHGLSGQWMDNIKRHEGKIRALNASFRVQEVVSTVVTGLKTDIPRQKIDAMFAIMDIMSQVAAESRVPIVSFFGDRIQELVTVAKQTLAQVDQLSKRIKERSGYCLGSGIATDDPRAQILDKRGILACPLAWSRKPWSDIFEQVEPAQGKLLFWDGKRFIDGHAAGGGKAGVQIAIKLLSAAKQLGYSTQLNVANIAAIYNVKFPGSLIALQKEAQTVIRDIERQAHRIKASIGTQHQCQRSDIIKHIESTTGLKLESFLDELSQQGSSRLITTYMASFLATQKLIKSKRQGAYQHYQKLWKNLKDIRIITIQGEVRAQQQPESPCYSCAGAILDIRVTQGTQVRGCEAWQADRFGNFASHIIGKPGVQVSLTATVKEQSSEPLTLLPADGVTPARLLVDAAKPENCRQAEALIASAQQSRAEDNLKKARQQLLAAKAQQCTALNESIDALLADIPVIKPIVMSCDLNAIQAQLKTVQAPEDSAKLNARRALLSAAAQVSMEHIQQAESLAELKNLASQLGALNNQLSGLTSQPGCATLLATLKNTQQFLQNILKADSQAKSALTSCRINALSQSKQQLSTIKNPYAQQRSEQIARVLAVIKRAKVAYDKGITLYRDTKPDAAKKQFLTAKKLLQQTQPDSSCTTQHDVIATALENTDKLTDAINNPELALQRCDAKVLLAAERKLANDPRAKALQSMRKTISQYAKIKKWYDRGQFKQAESTINTLKQTILKEYPASCQQLLTRLDKILARITTFRQSYARIEAAIDRCEINFLRTYHERIKSKGHRYFKPLLPKIAQAIPRCIQAHALKHCQKSFGSYARAVNIKNETKYQCQCKRGYQWNADRSGCIKKKSRAEILREGSVICRKEFGKHSYATRQNRNGTFECQCERGYRWNAKRSYCIKQPSPQQIMQAGHAQCRKLYGRYAYAMGVNRNGSYRCGCLLGSTWNITRNYCILYTPKPQAKPCPPGYHRNTAGRCHRDKVQRTPTYQPKPQCPPGYRWASGVCHRIQR